MADLTITSPLDWAHELERELHVPTSAANDAVLRAWAQIEGGHWHNTAYGNVLGTTTREWRLPSGQTVFGFSKPPGATQVSSPINSVGVQRYDSWRAGIAATVSMLSQANMRGIVDSLRANNPAPTTAAAIGDSPWLSGHTGNPAYTAKIDSVLGVDYNPAATHATPAQGAGSTQDALSLPSPGDLLGPLFGPLGGAAGDFASGITKPLISWVDSFAIRALLVIGGVIAILVGMAGLFDTGSGEGTVFASPTDDDKAEKKEQTHEHHERDAKAIAAVAE